MYVYKINILEELKKAGFNQQKLRKEKIFGGNTVERIKKNDNLTLNTLNIICIMLKCQISDIIEIVPTGEELQKLY